jgi:copper transport protein
VIVIAAPWRSRPLLVATMLLLGYLAVSSGLAGHSGATDPEGLVLSADASHVVAMSVWAGGLAFLLFVLPAATRQLAPPDRTQLLAGCLGRFSPLALGAVAVLVATGVLQSIVQLESLAG